MNRAFWMLLSLAISGCAPEPPEAELIKGRVIYIDGDALFANKEPFALRDCELALVLPGDRYNFKWPSSLAPSAETALVPAEDFTNASGEKFNPSRYKPKAILVDCADFAGKRYAGGKVIP